jgi:hypothetical protein
LGGEAVSAEPSWAMGCTSLAAGQQYPALDGVVPWAVGWDINSCGPWFDDLDGNRYQPCYLRCAAGMWSDASTEFSSSAFWCQRRVRTREGEGLGGWRGGGGGKRQRHPAATHRVCRWRPPWRRACSSRPRPRSRAPTARCRPTTRCWAVMRQRGACAAPPRTCAVAQWWAAPPCRRDPPGWARGRWGSTTCAATPAPCPPPGPSSSSTPRRRCWRWTPCPAGR